MRQTCVQGTGCDTRRVRLAVLEFNALNDVGDLVRAVQAAPLLVLADWHGLKTMVSAVMRWGNPWS